MYSQAEQIDTLTLVKNEQGRSTIKPEEIKIILRTYYAKTVKMIDQSPSQLFPLPTFPVFLLFTPIQGF